MTWPLGGVFFGGSIGVFSSAPVVVSIGVSVTASVDDEVLASVDDDDISSSKELIGGSSSSASVVVSIGSVDDEADVDEDDISSSNESIGGSSSSASVVVSNNSSNEFIVSSVSKPAKPVGSDSSGSVADSASGSVVDSALGSVVDSPADSVTASVVLSSGVLPPALCSFRIVARSSSFNWLNRIFTLVTPTKLTKYGSFNYCFCLCCCTEFYLRSFVRVKSISLSKGNPNGLSSKPEYPFVTS